MRLATVEHLGQSVLVAALDDALINLPRAHALRLAKEKGIPASTAYDRDRLEKLACLTLPRDMRSFLALGERAMEEAKRAIDFVSYGHSPERLRTIQLDPSEVNFMPPVPDPEKILCAGRNYADHIAEAKRPYPEVPVIFVRFPSTLVGHGSHIVRPKVSHELDWEGELAVIIGRSCRHIAPDEALDVVAGYSNFNDASLRDYQRRGVQFTAGKNFPATGGFGPFIVTATEAGDPTNMDLSVEVNGERMQKANTSDMIFGVAQLIAHISEWQALEPGDVIVTGTPGGVGFTREPPVFLKPGDSVSVTIGKLGTLTNRVKDEA